MIIIINQFYILFLGILIGIGIAELWEMYREKNKEVKNIE